MELDLPTLPHNVLKERLRHIDKQKEIELYYELLSSGRSVGDILKSLSHLPKTSAQSEPTIAKHSQSASGGAVPDMTSAAALMDTAQVNTQCTSSLSVIHDADSCRTAELRTAENASLNDLWSDDWEQVLDESLPRSESIIVRSAAVYTSTGSEIEIPPGNQQLRQPGKFSNSAGRIAFWALYTVAIASASIASFTIVSGGPNADPTTTRIQSGISNGAEAVAIRASAADGSETVDESLKATTQIVNTNSPSAPEASRSADPHSAVPGSLKREAAEVSITFPASTSHIRQVEEPSPHVKASAFTDHDIIGSETRHSRDVSVPMAKEIGGQQIVRAFYTALEGGDGEAASLLVIPEKREAGPFSAGELSRFYGRLELPLRLIEVNRAGENLYNVAYAYKVRNGRSCNGRSLVKTITLQNQVLIETIRSPSRC